MITAADRRPALGVLIPASNEAELIGGCLAALAASRWDDDAPVRVIVVANGCTDRTADAARALSADFAARGWQLLVIERRQGGKLAALNAGDTRLDAPIRVYLDADVVVEPALLAQLRTVLSCDQPRYASGRVRMTAQSWISRAYARIYRQVPFMTQGVPGCGVFAVNAAGRARWGAFPEVISDDTYVRLQFTPDERIGVPAGYQWPVVEGLRNLINVRRRQDTGVREIATRYPDIMKNEGKAKLTLPQKLKLAAKAPISFTIYTAIITSARINKNKNNTWHRGR